MSRRARAFNVKLSFIIIAIVIIVTIAKFKMSHMCTRYAVKATTKRKKKGKTDDTAVKTGNL